MSYFMSILVIEIESTLRCNIHTAVVSKRHFNVASFNLKLLIHFKNINELSVCSEKVRKKGKIASSRIQTGTCIWHGLVESSIVVAFVF